MDFVEGNIFCFFIFAYVQIYIYIYVFIVNSLISLRACVYPSAAAYTKSNLICGYENDWRKFGETNKSKDQIDPIEKLRRQNGKDICF